MAVLTAWEEDSAREAWDHTAWLCAVVANQNPFRGDKSRVATPDDFHPSAIRERMKRRKPDAGRSVRMPVSVLKGFFVKDG